MGHNKNIQPTGIKPVLVSYSPVADALRYDPKINMRPLGGEINNEEY